MTSVSRPNRDPKHLILGRKRILEIGTTYSIPFATPVAFSFEYIAEINAIVTSIPADTPDEVQIFPSATHLA